MVESNKFGTADYVPNQISAEDYADQLIAGCAKQKRGGVGGKGAKSHNFLEAKNANRRRHEKYEREAAKEEEQARQAWLAAENKKWAPVDKHDERNLKKLAEKNAKLVKKAEKAALKAEESD